MSTVDGLEKGYRRLLLAYPSGYREKRADEIVGTLLDSAAPGQTRPSFADAADLITGGLRQRIGLDADADLAAGWALAGPVALALAAGLSGFPAGTRRRSPMPAGCSRSPVGWCCRPGSPAGRSASPWRSPRW